MEKKSKSNKSIYQIAREKHGLSREQASTLLQYLSPERIERIENGKTIVHPEDIVCMATGYKSLDLCNHYCSHECSIGKNYFQKVELKNLCQITLELISLLNKINSQTNRLVDITKNNCVFEEDLEDFINFQKDLNDFAVIISNFDLWTRQQIIDGHINQNIYDSLYEQKKN